MENSKASKKYTLTLTQDLRPMLEELAEQGGFLWGENPNVHGFIRAIALKNCLGINHTKELPSISAVYFCIDTEGKILYIGQTKDLKARWKNHQKFKNLSEVPGVAISWIECPEENLEKVESVFIDLLTPPLNGKSNVYTVILQQADRPLLEKLAKKYKFKWGQRGNVQAFISAIAHNKFQLIPSEESEQEPEVYDSGAEVEHLLQAFWTLRDTGQDDAARSIANILLDRYETSSAVTQHLEAVVNRAEVTAIEEIKQAIAAKQPFTLSYQSASGREHEFDIQYAEIRKIDRHFYLCCWVEQLTDKVEIQALAHNMTLRLDRITEATIFPSLGKWRDKFDSIELQFKLIGGWARGYEAKPDDTESIFMLEDGIPVRYVKRRVHFWHWVGRELLRYGGDCVVLAPDDARKLIAGEVEKMYQNYL